MARKASLTVILAGFPKQNGCHITCLMSNGFFFQMGPYIAFTIAPRVWECEKQLIGSHGLRIFQNVEFDL